jgi:hypothetical protein
VFSEGSARLRALVPFRQFKGAQNLNNQTEKGEKEFEQRQRTRSMDGEKKNAGSPLP